MRRLFQSLTVALAVLMAAEAQAQQVNFADGRSYEIILPDMPNPPVIVALHGGGGNPAQFARNSGLTAPALAAGFAVIYPEGSARGGILRTWNGGYCCGYAASSGVDDVGFLDRVLADAQGRFGIDPARVYLTGMSNGAIMAQTYAAARPAQVRAVATVSGTLDLAHVAITGPVTLLHIHGTADTQVPYLGGLGSDGFTDTDFSSVPDTMAAFVAAAGQSLSPVQSAPVPDVVQLDYLTAAGAPMIRLLTLTGGEHVWPGGRRVRGAGAVDATQEVLGWFLQNP